MASGSRKKDEKYIRDLLNRLRDHPVDSEGATDEILTDVYQYLINVPVILHDKRLHWYCDRATPATRDAATFLTRLFAYKSEQSDIWKGKYSLCVSRCCECAARIDLLKVEAKETFLAAYNMSTRHSFFNKFEEWELGTVIQELSKAGIQFRDDDGENVSLAKAPSPLIYRIMSNFTIFNDSRIMKALRSTPFSKHFDDWPTGAPPAAVLLLMMSNDESHRQWAKDEGKKCPTVPLSKEVLRGSHVRVLESICSALTDGSKKVRHFKLPEQSEVLWRSFYEVLHFLPVEFLACGPSLNADVRRLVIRHLHDIGPEFMPILQSFLMVLNRLRRDMWKGEVTNYPEVVFDSVKDNPSFTGLAFNSASKKELPWCLGWFGPILATIKDQAVYRDTLAKMTAYLLEDLQHERFEDARPYIMESAMQFLNLQMKEADHKRSVAFVLDIHSDILVSVSFKKPYSGTQWKAARAASHELLKTTLTADADALQATPFQLARLYAKCARSSPPEKYSDVVDSISIRKDIWGKMYSAVQQNDSEAIAFVLSVVSRFTCLDALCVKACLNAKTKPFEKNIRETVSQFNSCLPVLSAGLLDAISRYVDSNESTSAIGVIQSPGVGRSLIRLMFSPIDDVQRAAHTLTGLAFDVDGRADCFRALLTHIPMVAFDGLFEVLESFTDFALPVPEACSLSKSLVRCFTDVVDVLCSGTDGLFHNRDFIRSFGAKVLASRVPQLWTMMNKAIGIIFSRTPLWSNYFDSADMVVWMRDALIFGRDMLAQLRVFRAAADSSSLLDGSTRSELQSSVAKKMVNDLQDTLLELTRWLRLTDEELLHQSFALLESLLDCFRDSQVRPAKRAMEKLGRYVSEHRNPDPNKPQSRLDSSRVNKLEAALTSFDVDSDDDIEFVGEIKAAKPKAEAKDKASKATKAALKVSQCEASKRDKGKQKDPKKAYDSRTIQKPSAAGLADREERVSKDTQSRKLDSVRAESSKPTQATKSKLTKPPVVSPGDDPSASSSSDEDQSQSQGGLMSYAQKMQRSPKIRKIPNRPQVQRIDIPMARNPMEERLRRQEEARRTALRMKPNITGLHRALLSWNYDHDGQLPPGPSLQCERVPDKFKDYEHYRRVFEPLLLLECWGQLQSSKEEPQQIQNCQICSRGYIDDWLDIEITVNSVSKKDWYLTETDLVLLRQLDRKQSILGKVQNYKSTPQETHATIRCYCPSGKGDPGLAVNSTWHLSKVMNLATLHREYGALMSMQYYDFQESLLRPELPRTSKLERRIIEETMSRYYVNEPQAIAICSALRTNGLTLIQGPPGTGKTSTICGLVTAALKNRATPIVSGRNNASSEKSTAPKVLICAPSNAAIDEIAKRIKEGYRGSQKGPSGIPVVRVGADSAINVSVKDVSLDTLVDEKLGPLHKGNDTANEIALVRQELESVKEQRRTKLQELTNVHDNAARTQALEDDIKRINSQRMTLSHKFDQLKDKQKSDLRSMDAARRKARLEVVQEADVICSTLSGSGHELLEQFDFEMVVIDEAAQAIELSTLIPMKYRWKRCVMVGDPQQLPPTVLSMEASKYLYNQSLFVRMQKQCPEAVHLLSIQYRMHPDISQLPSQLFYNGKLKDGPAMAEKTRQPWHTHSVLGTYRFFDVAEGHEEKSKNSLKNEQECKVAVSLYNRLIREFSSFDFEFKIGIVSMYRAQIVELRRIFERQFGREVLRTVDFNTVDGFQGQEKDIIILSCVRSGPGVQNVGFLSDVRRMNVALTRAKSSLFVLGNAATLERSDKNWSKIVGNARDRNFYTGSVKPSLFTTSVSSTRTAIAEKPRKPATQNLPPIPAPSDLRRPGEFKSDNSGPSSTQLEQRVSSVGLKRKNEPDSPAETRVGTSSQQPPAAPRPAPAVPVASHPAQPPTKRQKKESSIFIPNKRRAQDQLQGPPNNRKKQA